MSRSVFCSHDNKQDSRQQKLETVTDPNGHLLFFIFNSQILLGISCRSLAAPHTWRPGMAVVQHCFRVLVLMKCAVSIRIQI